MMLKEFKLKIWILFLSEILWNNGNNCCLLIVSKNFNVDLHADVFQLIYFQVGMMIDSIEFYILILV